MNVIKIGDKLYQRRLKLIEEVEVIDIFLEKYINDYKTIIRVVTKGNIAYTHFVSNLGIHLFTEIPKDSDVK